MRAKRGRQGTVFRMSPVPARRPVVHFIEIEIEIGIEIAIEIGIEIGIFTCIRRGILRCLAVSFGNVQWY